MFCLVYVLVGICVIILGNNLGTMTGSMLVDIFSWQTIEKEKFVRSEVSCLKLSSDLFGFS